MVRNAFLFAALTVGTLMGWPGDIQAAKVGQKCGTSAAIQCDAGLWCDPKAGRCGAADVEGTCVKVAATCPKNLRPVCGCDGQAYNNDCERRLGKEAKNHNGKC